MTRAHAPRQVATYIKCGTTWAEQIVLLLLHGPAAVARLDPTRRNTYQPGQAEVGKIWLERTVAPGLGRIVALRGRSSTPYQIL